MIKTLVNHRVKKYNPPSTIEGKYKTSMQECYIKLTQTHKTIKSKHLVWLNCSHTTQLHKMNTQDTHTELTQQKTNT